MVVGIADKTIAPRLRRLEISALPCHPSRARDRAGGEPCFFTEVVVSACDAGEGRNGFDTEPLQGGVVEKAGSREWKKSLTDQILFCVRGGEFRMSECIETIGEFGVARGLALGAAIELRKLRHLAHLK